MLIHAIAHEGVRTHVRKTALSVDCGRKIPCLNGESNLRQRRDGPMLYQLSYIQTPLSLPCCEQDNTTRKPVMNAEAGSGADTEIGTNKNIWKKKKKKKK